MREGSHEAASALRGYLVEEEIREGEAGEGAVVLEVAEGALVARIREALPLVEPPAAELEGMAPLEERELLRELVALDVVELGGGRVAEAIVTADVERAQTGDRLPARDAHALVGVADARPVRGDRLELHVGEAHEQLVEGAGAQGVRPVEGRAEEG